MGKCTHEGERRHRYTVKHGWQVWCPKCNPVHVRNAAPYLGGLPMSDSSRRDFRHVVTKREYRDLETAKHVDQAFDTFHAKYPHLGHPGPVKDDPWPDVQITDGPENNG